MMRVRLLAAAAFFLLALSSMSAQNDPAGSADERRLQQVERDGYASRTVRLRKTSAAYEPVLDITYYRLNLRIAEQKNFLSGDVTASSAVTKDSLALITYDLNDAMTFDSVLVEGVRSPFARGPMTVRITTPRFYRAGDRVTTRVFYHGSPPNTGLGSYTDSLRASGARWVYTLSEPYGARDWWPCIDEPADKADSADIWITCRAGLRAVTNGRLDETLNNPDGTVTYKWKERYPIATYLIPVTIGDFTSFSDWYVYSPTDSMEVVNYVLPDIAETSPNYRANAALVPQMLQVYASIFGQYPFIREKYGHAEFGWGGGMEHQTLTSLGPRAFTVSTMAHELAHQWFGDMITCRTWGDLWLNEGFAQYWEAVWHERTGGAALYAAVMAGRAASAKKAAGTLFVQDTADVNNLFNVNRVYDKGSWVLHMLRHAVGDSLFFQSIRAYANDPALKYATASTADLRRVFERVTGRDLAWFFNEWVFGEGYPAYSYTLTSTKDPAAGFLADVHVRQIMPPTATNPAFFVMPIDLKFFAAGGWDTTLTVWNDAADQTIQAALSHNPDSVQLDPGQWILHDAARSVAGNEAPLEYRLAQNYPNPFNPSTTITFSLAARSQVSIRLYDVLGREVATLLDADRAAGTYDIPFDARGLSSGVYIYRMTAVRGASVFSAARKLLLVR